MDDPFSELKYILKIAIIIIAAVFIILTAIFAIGGSIGPGTYEIGYVIVGLSIVGGIIVACTVAIIDTIKKMHKDLK